MEDVYVLMLVALTVLAVIDLVVGVSNDAVNFLNSAIGSKAISIKTIMIIASLGIAFGAVSSSGMMEVARKGIFVPSEFFFNEIMYIFMAVMITDILLLDVFNSLGMPTSTTVSIVFELLGAAVAMALIKISADNTKVLSDLPTYINTDKAVQIIVGILLSVVVAFSIGAIVQFTSRMIFSFKIESKKVYIGALFGGFALTAITYFIFVKGIKGTPFYGDIKDSIEGKNAIILSIGFVVWTAISALFIKVFKINIFKVIIVIGTFSLAMAFAGNDLVNFVGVPIAAWNSYQAWVDSGVAANEFSMGILDKKVPSSTLLLLLAGGIMILTLWFSKKAKNVIETGISLSRQGEGKEKFDANPTSRIVVRFSRVVNDVIIYVLPERTIAWINNKFEKPVVHLPKNKTFEIPAFDMVRASVNLVVAGILISIGTSLKLPLSTTYVTFMVAMGTSLADRAWGRDSAVYRVAGVINVVAGWFLTAFVAFTVSAIFLYIISIGGVASISFLLILVFTLMGRNTLKYTRKKKEEKEQKIISKAELKNVKGVVKESSDNINAVLLRVGKLYTNVVNDLALGDFNKLGKTDKHVDKLNKEIDELKDNVFFFIKSLDENSVQASRFYILVLGYLQDIAQSISYISRVSYKHVNNQHKNLKKGQVKDLKHINNDLQDLLAKISILFESDDYTTLSSVIEEKQLLFNKVSESIEKHIKRIRTDESSQKNTMLYFGVLLETKDLISAIMSILNLYEEFDISDYTKELK